MPGLLLALIVTSIALAGPVGPSGDAEVLASSEDFLRIEDARWTIVEAHAPENGTFYAHSNLTVEMPPNDIRNAFIFLDEDWTPVGHFWWAFQSTGEATIVRAREPDNTTHRITTPSLEDTYNNSGLRSRLHVDWTASGDEGDSLVGYIAVLTPDDDARFNVTETASGWIGNHTQGRETEYKRVRNWDRVGFHGKISQEGPAVTLDAHEQKTIDDELLSMITLVEGRGEAGWTGPGDRSWGCHETVNSRGCPGRQVVTGLAGPYDFFIDHHYYLTGDDSWVMLSDVVRP